MRATTVVRKLLGLCQAVVVCSGELADDGGDGARPRLVVTVRIRAGRRGRCGRCGAA